MVDNKVFILLLSFISLVISPTAKNIYSQPDLSKASSMLQTFTIDFMGIDTPESTIWSLCKWQMNLQDLKNHNEKVISNGDVFGGFQTTKDGKAAFLSFSEIIYYQKGKVKSINATRIYPEVNKDYFEGKGEEGQYVHQFEWNSHNWYRFVIHTWMDFSAKTFVGAWIQDLSTKEWTLFSYFNTHLNGSYISGGLSQSQENYNEESFGEERSFQIKNMYVYDMMKKKWLSLNKSTLYYDPEEWGYDTAGTHDIGFTKNYFYGSSGLSVDDKNLYDASNPENVTGTINQPEEPDFDKPKFEFVEVEITAETLTVTWKVDSKSTPCYKYQIDVFIKSGLTYKSLFSYISYKPEETRYFNQYAFEKGDYQFRMVCTAISNAQQLAVEFIDKKLTY